METYTLHFEDYNEDGEAMYGARDSDNIDPIGEYITLDDYFLTDKQYKII